MPGLPPTSPTPSEFLQRWLKQTPAPWRIGQVVLLPAGETEISILAEIESSSDSKSLNPEDPTLHPCLGSSVTLLVHEADAAGIEGDAAKASELLGRLKRLETIEQFREWLRWDDSGKFRPLRAAPTIRPGWVFGPLNFTDLVVALRFLYPGALADWTAREVDALPLTTYEQSAARQSGRFSVVRKLGTERLTELLRDCCEAGCLRDPLWADISLPPELAATLPSINLSMSANRPDLQIPLLCPEACNYFISKAREKILGRVD